MDSLDKYTNTSIITTPFNLTYSYYTSPNFQEQIKANPELPILLFIHGFPDDAHMWSMAVDHFTDLGYPLILPDLLGFGGSSKPADPRRYNYKAQANSLIQCLDNEGLADTRRIVIIGHDWGSATAQRTYLYHRERFIGICILSLAYQVPSPNVFSLWTANHETTKRFGYGQWYYWEFFCAPDAPEIMRQRPDLFWEVNNGNFPSPLPEENGRDIWMREMFCVKNGMRDYMEQTGKWKNRRVELKPYPEGEKQYQRFKERMCRDGFEGPVNYYHSLANNTMLDDERELCEKGPNGEDKRKIEVPMLYVGQTGDWVCRTDLMIDAKNEGLVDDLEEKVVDAGHWCLYEKPIDVAEAISEWVVRRFPAKK